MRSWKPGPRLSSRVFEDVAGLEDVRYVAERIEEVFFARGEVGHE